MVPKLDPFELKMERTTPICRKMAQSHCICSDGIRITTVHTVYEVYIISAASDVNMQGQSQGLTWQGNNIGAYASYICLF